MNRGLFVVMLLLVSGCYQATINTGLQPSAQTISRPWAHGFLYGLVPPSTIETMQTCTTGVARVETKHSFLNQVAYALTWGIYSPMTIIVTCAQGNEQDSGMATALPVIYDEEIARSALLNGGSFYVDLR